MGLLTCKLGQCICNSNQDIVKIMFRSLDNILPSVIWITDYSCTHDFDKKIKPNAIVIYQVEVITKASLIAKKQVYHFSFVYYKHS